MVLLPNIDGHIWNLETKIPEMLLEYQKTSKLVLHLNYEGPDASKSRLYDLLDNLSQKFNFDKKKITIITNNVLERHTEYKIVNLSPLYVDTGQQFASKLNIPKKTIEKHFGIFIGRSNWTRLLLSAKLYSNYKEKTIQTFHYNPSLDFHRSNLGLENLLHYTGKEHLQNAYNLLLDCPIAQEIPEYPIVTPEHFNISKIYPSFFVDIVCETYCLGTTFYPTEKIWRPIICMTPFMVQGPVNFLKNLKKLGFKTFSNYWDESYDEDGFYGIKTIISNIEYLSKLSVEDLNKMYDSMKPILENNYKTFMAIKGKSWKIFYDDKK